ncbi:hypothetical protein, partial [Staphylococcus aureus]|uniref:hypothetical protein n=1 Tax=Staphylococcus aureus TaxID=1280 RepID=UPI00210B5725
GNDVQAHAQARHVLDARREATIEEMRDNKFLAIEALLKALVDRDRPVTRDALWKALADLGMDQTLLQALELRSRVRLDEIYADDRQTMIDSRRCCASSADEMALRNLIESMTLRTDEAMLKPLRQLFQDFVDGKTA